MSNELEGAISLPSKEELRKKKARLMNEENIVMHAEKKRNEAHKKVNKEATELAETLAKAKAEHNASNIVISKAEYQKFLNTGEVSAYRLELIAQKVKDHTDLDPAEKDIFANKTAEINDIIREKWPAETVEIRELREKGSKNFIGPVVPEWETKRRADQEIANKKKEKESRKMGDTFRIEFGFDPMKELPGFSEMNESLQNMVLHNLRQVRVDLVEEAAKEIYEKEGKGFLGWKKLFKAGFTEANKEKAKTLVYKEGFKRYGKYAKAIFESVKNTGLGAVKDSETGQLNIEYAHGLENLTPEEKKIVEAFNRQATNFGDMPSEWGLDESSKLDKFMSGRFADFHKKSDFDAAEEKYNKQREKISSLLLAKFGNDQQKATDYLRMIDANIDFNQRIAKDPDAMQAAAAGAQLGVVTKKGMLPSLSFVTGYTVRGGAETIGVLNWAGLVIAPALGALRGYFKGKENVRETLVKARAGIRDEKVKDTAWNKYTGKLKEEELKEKLLSKFKAFDEKKIITNTSTGVKREMSGGLTGKVSIAWKSFESAQNRMLGLEQALATASEEDKKELTEEYASAKEVFALRQGFLANRLAIAQKELDENVIDFGQPHQQFTNKYAMQTAMNKGYALLMASPLAQYGDLKGKDAAALKALTEKFETKFAGVIAERMKQENLTKEQSEQAAKSLVKLSMLKGATTGLIFGGLGFGARHLWNEYGDSIKDMFSSAEKIDMPGTPTAPDFHQYSEAGVDKGAAEYLRTKDGVHNPDGTITQKTGEALVERGITQDFSVILGKNGVPVQLERVFHEIAMDHMQVPNDLLNEEIGAKSLNVAANLVKLSEGRNVLGASTSAFKDSFSFDKSTGILKIVDHTKFNNLMNVLEKHSEELWKGNKLGGATGELSNIKTDTWLKIAHADDIEKAIGADGKEFATGIHGHDDITKEKITDFHRSDIVEGARKLRGVTDGTSTPASSIQEEAWNQGNRGGADRQTIQEEAWDKGNNGGNNTSQIKEEAWNQNNKSRGNFQGSQKQDFFQSGADDLDTGTPPPQNSAPAPEDTPPVQGNTPAENIPQPAAASPEVQTADIYEKIFKVDDLSKSTMWKEVKGESAANLFKMTEKTIHDSPNGELNRLWAYMKKLTETTQLSIDVENKETIEHYIERANRVWLNKNPNKSLEDLYLISTKYLENVKK